MQSLTFQGWFSPMGNNLMHLLLFKVLYFLVILTGKYLKQC